jgi:hypothetical protein
MGSVNSYQKSGGLDIWFFTIPPDIARGNAILSAVQTALQNGKSHT